MGSQLRGQRTANTPPRCKRRKANLACGAAFDRSGVAFSRVLELDGPLCGHVCTCGRLRELNRVRVTEGCGVNVCEVPVRGEVCGECGAMVESGNVVRE
jgi:hypothetical protein